MKQIFLTFLLFGLLTSCNNSEEKAVIKTTKKTLEIKDESSKVAIYDTVVSKEESKIWDSIFKLPEVKSRIKYVDSVTQGKRRLHVWTFKKPDKKDNFYWIKVSENNGSFTVAHFNFFVYPKNEIKYFDTVNDSILTLDEWRKK